MSRSGPGLFLRRQEPRRKVCRIQRAERGSEGKIGPVPPAKYRILLFLFFLFFRSMKLFLPSGRSNAVEVPEKPMNDIVYIKKNNER